MKFFITLLTLAMTIITFQNCGQVSISPKIDEPSYALSKTSFSATVCPQTEPLPPESTKFVFVVDMSLSNIGAANTAGYFSKSLGSDRDGERFNMLESFITDCAKASGNQYSIVAFANGAGRITTVAGKTTFKCDGSFVPPSQAQTDIEAVRQEQDKAKSFWDPYDGKPYYGGYDGLMGNTSYSQALNCVRDIILNDLSNPAAAGTAQNYEVLFLSDGQPRDASKLDASELYQSGCEYKYNSTDPGYEACYLKEISDPISYTMQVLLGNNKNIRYHAIYYTAPANLGAPAAVEKYMGEIANLGGTYQPTMLGLLKDELKTGKNPLCEISQIKSSLEFRPEVLTLVNLTAKRVNGVLEPDSDMDGLTDRQELEMGSDPLNPRSKVSGVLDGICDRVGGFAACQTMRNKIICDGTPNAMGVSDCDLKILKIDKLYAHPDSGIDSDKDGMPDIIEILRGTDPGLRDMSADPDGDGRTNKQEILENTEVNRFDTLKIPAERPEYTVRYIDKQQAQVCSYGAWQLQATTLPGADTKKFTSVASTNSWFNHEAGENVYLVYYRQDPTNSAKENVQFFGAIVKSHYLSNDDKSSIEVILDKNIIIPVDFVKLGEVLP